MKIRTETYELPKDMGTSNDRDATHKATRALLEALERQSMFSTFSHKDNVSSDGTANGQYIEQSYTFLMPGGEVALQVRLIGGNTYLDVKRSTWRNPSYIAPLVKKLNAKQTSNSEGPFNPTLFVPRL
jgi:hypothetical protein